MSELHEYGWCHNCETFQLLRDAPLINALGDGPEPCCRVCRGQEPWQFGVWDVAQFVRDGIYTLAEVTALCEQGVSAYPGDVRPKAS